MQDLVAAALCLITAGVIIPQFMPYHACDRESLSPSVNSIFISILLILCAASFVFRWFTGRLAPYLTIRNGEVVLVVPGIAETRRKAI